MSKCDCSYTGIEPSPKGFGYCAHNEKKFTIKKGTDGRYYYADSKWKLLKIPSNWFYQFKKNRLYS